MNADEFVKALRKAAFKRSFNTENVTIDVKTAYAAAILIESLQAQIAQQQSNEPLTLDELRGMDGRPIWESWTESWRIVTTAHDGVTTSLYNVYNSISAKSVLYNDGLIYRRPPERSEDNA